MILSHFQQNVSTATSHVRPSVRLDTGRCFAKYLLALKMLSFCHLYTIGSIHSMGAVLLLEICSDHAMSFTYPILHIYRNIPYSHSSAKLEFVLVVRVDCPIEEA